MRRVLVGGLVCLAVALVAWQLLGRTLQPSSAGVHVRWAPQVDEFARQAAEQRYGLADGSAGDGRTWAYSLTNTSAGNVRALVSDPAVEDTSDIDRAAFRVSRESTRGHRAQSTSPRVTARLRVLVVLAGLIGLAAVCLGLAGLVAPGAMAAMVGARAPARVPLSGRQRAALVLIIGAAVALDVGSMRRMTLTVDEAEHLRYGRNVLDLDSSRFDDSKMPISALNAIPGALAREGASGAQSSWLARPETARYATVAFFALTALCVFAWSRRLYGAGGAFLAVTCYAFDPNILAHAQLTTTDLYAAGTIAIALYFFWRFLTDGGWRLGVVSALTLGLAQVAKYTAIVLFPLFVLLALIFYVPALRRLWQARRGGELWRGAVAFAAVTVAFVAISLVVVNIGFVFNQTLTPFDQYSLHSSTLRTLQASVGRVGELPLPTPYPYLEGLDLVMDHERTGSSFGRAYLFGELRDGGFPGYYLWACLYKVPLALQAVVLLAAASYVTRRHRFDFLSNEAFLLVPVAFFAVYFNFFYKAQIGIRYFLVVFPLLYVFAGSLLAGRPVPSRPLIVTLATMSAALLLSVLSYYPHFIPYFNELVWDRTQAYRILADSNLDWGQYGQDLDTYRAGHPGSVWEPDQPVAGTILVRVNMLTGVSGDPERFRWLRERFQPVSHIAHGILVYRVTADALDTLGARP